MNMYSDFDLPECAQTILSSSNKTFILLSAKHQMTETSEIYSEEDYDSIWTVLHYIYIDSTWNTSRFDIVYCDFEGEMLGPGGVLTLATFMHEDENRPGVLIDMTCAKSASMTKMILECKHLQKVGWGLELSDLPCLMHAHDTFERILPVNLVDIQLLFSTSVKKRLGLQKAMNILRRLHPEHMQPFPNKDCIPWDKFYSKNRGLFKYPLSDNNIQYAANDVVIIALVTYFSDDIWRYITYYWKHNQPLPNLWYDIIHMSQKVQQTVNEDIYHYRWFCDQWKELKRTNKTWNYQRHTAQAVKLKRYIMSMHKQYKNTNKISPSHLSEMKQCAQEVDALLEHANVTIPEDLSFYE